MAQHIVHSEHPDVGQTCSAVEGRLLGGLMDALPRHMLRERLATAIAPPCQWQHMHLFVF